jgi:hypothetical protein
MYQRITTAGYGSIGRQTFNIWAVLVSLGLMEKGNYTDPMIDTHREFFETLKKTDPEGYQQFPIKGKEVLEIKRKLAKKIDDFFVENQLEEFREESVFGGQQVGLL